MKKEIITLMATAILALPVVGFSASHSMDHDSMKGMDHGSKKMDESKKMDDSMIMLPEQTVDGITAMVHLKDVKATMAKMGMKQTHHFMVMFKDQLSGTNVVAKVAAVKIVTQDGTEGESIELPTMQGHSGADVILAVPGAYTFKVAAKLPGDKKVQYEFKYTLK